MPYVVKPINRNQVTMSTLNFMVEWDSIARVIDCFVDHIDLKEPGFEKTEPNPEGRPCYDPQSMLKLYLYGYRKNIRSSRKLAEACVTNIEVMWMLGGLRPDFRTISDFRKDNAENLKGVFKEFIKRVTVDVKTGYVSIDGSKFKAWNGKDSNFTIMKLDDRIRAGRPYAGIPAADRRSRQRRGNSRWDTDAGGTGNKTCRDPGKTGKIPFIQGTDGEGEPHADIPYGCRCPPDEK